jgi:hypothetical protein
MKVAVFGIFDASQAFDTVYKASFSLVVYCTNQCIDSSSACDMPFFRVLLIVLCLGHCETRIVAD